ncbi:hypothetical protein [Caldimonas tepidiphila]|uniref:hypothetical protein n=1 Tax=Caldimonas tepidiphila TaxID=2315841 RepID=UPI000E5BA17F|nr:hypothetical protein [Caldimonas tepidiphila]
MPFTLFFVRVLASLLLLLLAASALGMSSLMRWSALGCVWSALAGIAVFFLEAIGALSRAADFFFGPRR